MWSADINTLITSGDPISRSFTLEVRNGYMAAAADPWVEVPLMKDGWVLSIIDGNPVIGVSKFTIPIDDYTYLDEFDPANPVQLFAACRLKCSVHAPTGLEEEYIFRGMLKTPERADLSISVEARDPLDKMQTALCDIEMVARIEGPYSDVNLDHADNWDDPGDLNTFEIKRNNAPPYNWAYFDDNAAVAGAARRVWVPMVFEVEKQTGGVGPWESVLASEYIVDTPYGLIRFHNSQLAPDKFRLVEVSVYVEGTLELADVIEAMLVYPAACPSLGCGFDVDASPLTDLSTDLTGTLTFTAGNKTVTAVGGAFLTEISHGDRIHLQGMPAEYYGMVAFVTNDNLLDLLYDYEGPVGGAGTAYKSTLRMADVCLSNVRWSMCDGTVATLYRQLQENYADSKGYKIWYDPMTDQVRGDRVGINYSNVIDLGPIMGLPLAATSEDFASAVVTTGDIARAENLITKAGVTITAHIEIDVPPDGFGPWSIGPSVAGPGVQFGVNYLNNPAAVYAMNDTSMYQAYAVHYDYPTIADKEIGLETYYKFVTIDLGAIYNLSQISLHTIPQKDSDPGYKQAVTIYHSLDDVTYDICSPETYKAELKTDEWNEFDVQDIVTARYIQLWVRPFYWPNDGKELTIGFREIIIFGSQKICISACIQDATPPDVINLTGNITFTAGGPPWVLNGAGSAFLAELAPGDMVAVSGDLSNWAEVWDVTNNTIAVLVDRYPGIQGATGPGRKAAFMEGVGGHFIGGSGVMHDFVLDYYPDLVAKLTNVTHQPKMDDEGLVFTEFQALDRAYLLLQEYIRLYRTISLTSHFDPRIMVFDTVMIEDDYRESGPEQLYFLVQAVEITDSYVKISGTEFGAGVLR